MVKCEMRVSHSPATFELGEMHGSCFLFLGQIFPLPNEDKKEDTDGSFIKIYLLFGPHFFVLIWDRGYFFELEVSFELAGDTR